MFTKIKDLTYLLLITGIIALTGCSAAAAVPQQVPVQTPAQTITQQNTQPPQQSTSATVQSNNQPVAQVPAQNTMQQNTSSGTSSTTNSMTSPALSNRVDVVYFHTKLRCVTCLCFEEQVTNVIKTYFQDAINSGKLTYKVLNVQDSKNSAIAKKYSALGSQLFINTVTNNFDSIEDIQDIWYWNCVDKPADFDQKVKNLIELRLKGQR